MKKIINMNRLFKVSILFIGNMLILCCSKQKFEPIPSQELTREEVLGPNSSIRIINLGKYRDVILDNDTLSSNENAVMYSSVPSINFDDPNNYGILGPFWRIPQKYLNVNKPINLQIKDIDKVNVNFQISTNLSKQMDYYTLNPNGNGQPWIVPIARDESSPKKEGYFKIRLLNLTQDFDPLPYRSAHGYPMADLYGPITLTYSDGTPISLQTSNVDLQNRVSEYIELPYGAYQFKVFTSDGQELSGMNHGVNALKGDIRFFEPATSFLSTEVDGAPKFSITPYSPVMTYKAGAVYTIAVSGEYFKYFTNPYSKTYATAVQNQYKIIEDYVPTINKEYCKIQAVNAVSDQVSIRLNGQKLSSNLNIGENTEYSIFNADEDILCEIVNIKNQVLYSKKYRFNPSDNISLWVCYDEELNIKIEPVMNKLSTQIYLHRDDDNAWANRVEFKNLTSIRFMNFSKNERSINFIINNNSGVVKRVLFGNAFPHNPLASINLIQGKSNKMEPYVYWDEFFVADQAVSFNVFRYTNATPGERIVNVDGLSSQKFISNSEFYHNLGRYVPSYAAGTYTVALIGDTNSSGEDKARIIHIKHTK